MLTVYEGLPPGLLASEARDLHRVLPGPSLIFLPGRREPALFVSVLLHGNEDVGLKALQAVLRRHAATGLPRMLAVFVGNVHAARENRRRLDGQPDYNRIWPGTEQAPSPETAMAAEVVERVARGGVFASIDLHNNTGLNPPYACVNHLEAPFLQLATQFSRTVVYFRRPRGLQAMAMAAHCPAVTLECGQVGNVRGLSMATEYLDACLHMVRVASHPVADHDIDLFQVVAQVHVAPGVSFGFNGAEADLIFRSELDRMNFQELPRGTCLGELRRDVAQALLAWDGIGADVNARYFEARDGHICLKRTVMPSMLTLDERIIRQDCLCYLMERVAL